MRMTRDAGRRIFMMEISARRPEPLHKSLWQKCQPISSTSFLSRCSFIPLTELPGEGIVSKGRQVFVTTSPERNCTWNESFCV